MIPFNPTEFVEAVRIAMSVEAYRQAQGIEAPSGGETGNTGLAEGKSPVPKGCAQNPEQSA